MRAAGYHRHERETELRNWRPDEFEEVEESKVPVLIDAHYVHSFPDGYYRIFGEYNSLPPAFLREGR
jgi:hypothetical protein